jgi:hypothetical protein
VHDLTAPDAMHGAVLDIFLAETPAVVSAVPKPGTYALPRSNG